MEGVREMALAAYQNFSDDRKQRIQNAFNRAVEDDNYTQQLSFYSIYGIETVDKCLEMYKEYTKGRFDFNDFVTLIHILEYQTVLVCDVCSSLILGQAFFTCQECFFHSPDAKSYDVCCTCYASKKFKDHNHSEFYDARNLLDESKRMFYKERREKEGMSDFIDNVMINMAGDMMEIATSIKTEGWKKFENVYSRFKRDEKAERINGHLSELKQPRPSQAKEISTVEEERETSRSSEKIRAKEEDEEEKRKKEYWSSSWRASQDRSDLVGANPSFDLPLES